jgi:hypothetical protein
MRMREMSRRVVLVSRRERPIRIWFACGIFSGLMGIPVTYFEAIFLHFHFWPSLIGWLIGTVIIAPTALSLHWLKKHSRPLLLPALRVACKRARTYTLGEAILLSEHLIACKMHKNVCLCCEQRTSIVGYTWIYLFVIRENKIQYMDMSFLRILFAILKKLFSVIEMFSGDTGIFSRITFPG